MNTVTLAYISIWLNIQSRWRYVILQNT